MGMDRQVVLHSGSPFTCAYPNMLAFHWDTLGKAKRGQLMTSQLSGCNSSRFRILSNESSYYLAEVPPHTCTYKCSPASKTNWKYDMYLTEECQFPRQLERSDSYLTAKLRRLKMIQWNLSDANSHKPRDSDLRCSRMRLRGSTTNPCPRRFLATIPLFVRKQCVWKGNLIERNVYQPCTYNPWEISVPYDRRIAAWQAPVCITGYGDRNDLAAAFGLCRQLIVNMHALREQRMKRNKRWASVNCIASLSTTDVNTLVAVWWNWLRVKMF